MSTHIRRYSRVLALVGAYLAQGCSDDAPPAQVDAGLGDAGADVGGAADGGDAPPSTRTFELRFRAQVGTEDVSCTETYGGFGPGGERDIRFSDFRFYVHGVELLRDGASAVPLVLDDEGPWQHDGVALLDFEDASGTCTAGTSEVRNVVRGRAPEGVYTGVRFVLGVPFASNHQDASAAVAPLNLTGLFWNWQGGYKFVRADITSSPVVGGDPRPAFNVHLGSTGCDGSPAGGVTMCAVPNRATIELDAFDPDVSAIVADYAQLLEGVDPAINTAETAPGCMSGATDPECTEVMTSLGLPHGAAPASMDFFRVGAR